MRLLKIGSSQDCDIVLNSRKVSALHAEITLLNNGDILLEDKGSTNGTFVNNQPVKPGASVPIRRGDLVRFADMELQWASVPQPTNNSMFKKIYGIGSNMRYNEIQVPGNSVSRFHATLKIDKRGRAYIEDHSMNGTTVNGKRITSHQNIRVKRNDDVVVGGVPINLKQYIKPDVWSTVAKVTGGVAAAAAVVALVVMLWHPNHGDGNPPVEALMQATPCVIGSYYIDVTIKDDPFKDLFKGMWPESWQFGYDYNNDEWILGGSDPCIYYGTAFFISQYGEMGTNRHIAVPWESVKASGTDKLSIRMQMIEKMNEIFGDYRKEQSRIEAEKVFIRAAYGVEVDESDEEKFFRQVMALFDKCEFEISGHFQYLGILLPGHNFTTLSDLMSCQVIAESGDPEKDVALLRLNTPRTPEHIVKKGYYQIRNARLDETKLALSEQLQTIGYPAGLGIGLNMGNGRELNPTIYNTNLSRKPDDNRFQVQTVTMGGQSGSPVFDGKRNLVGVLFGMYTNTQITYCCNIKHLVELYEKHKWVE